MSSPSPDPQKSTDHTYQSSETSDHGLLNHSLPCPCEKTSLDASKTDLHPHCIPKLNHHHNIIALSHSPPNANHVHPHSHAHGSPKTATCTCHFQEDTDVITDSDTGRKIEPDDRIEVSNLPPALPPRPPPRPRLDGTINSRHRPRNRK